MIVTCKGFRATPLASGEIRLEIEEPLRDALSENLSLKEIATILCKSVKAVDKLSRRAKNPLPIHRGKGRPFLLRSEVNAWLEKDDRFPIHAGQIRSVFG